MLSEIKLVLIVKRIYQQRKLENILVSVIGADVELWQAFFYRFFCAEQGVFLAALNVHFDERKILAEAVDADGFDLLSAGR